MRNKKPTMSDWQDLYDAAIEFKKEKPWQWLYDARPYLRTKSGR